jgi:hypothetical protein
MTASWKSNAGDHMGEGTQSSKDYGYLREYNLKLAV